MFLNLTEKLDEKGKHRPLLLNADWIAAVEIRETNLYGGSKTTRETIVIMAIPKDAKGNPHAAKHYEVAESYEDVRAMLMRAPAPAESLPNPAGPIPPAAL